VRPIGEMFSLLRRWREGSVVLRADGREGPLRFFVEGVVDCAEDPLLRLNLFDCGFMEFTFDKTWQFEFGAPDAMKVPLDERTGQSSSASKHYEFGEMIIAASSSGARVLLVEIVRGVD